uniref:UbiA prenyltransferase n=1 Tax=Solibacter usitatus (strain Ellin6076) TaxID=234267 RepID=Q01UL7_SOLUE
MTPRAKITRSPWIWPNLLSLDAPVIALLWQALLARTFAIPIRPAGRLVLGLTVWVIYLADRLLDTRAVPFAGEPARHLFYRRHFRGAIAMLIGALLADFALTLFALRPPVFHNGLLALAGVALYLAALHWKPAALRVPKELAVAVLFTVGVFLVSFTNSAAPLITLWLPALTFFLLCLTNLVAIEHWEWRELRGARPHDTGRLVAWLARWFPIWTFALAASSLAASPHSPWYRAIALSLVATLCLFASGRRLPLEVRRILVDAALLTPLLFFW